MYNAEPPNSLRPSFHHRTISIEFIAEPSAESTRGIARILSLYNPQTGADFFLGQWRSHLIIRTKFNRFSSQKQGYKTVKGYREIGLRDALPAGQGRVITVTSDPQHTTVYIDGTLAKTFPDYALIPEGISGDEHLLLGNAPTGSQYWTGVFRGLALYDRLLSQEEAVQNSQMWTGKGAPAYRADNRPVALYLFNEGTGNTIHNYAGHGPNLLIPPAFNPIEKTFLGPPWNDFRISWSFIRDVVTNVFGFIPFGLFVSALVSRLTALRRWGAGLTTLLLGACLSLVIELIQAYIPTRNSSLTDLFTNIVGTFLGILLAHRFHTLNSSSDKHVDSLVARTQR